MGLERSSPARGRPLVSGDEGRGAATHGGRDTAKVDSPPLREHLGCSGRHVLDAMHWGDRCHHQVYRDRACDTWPIVAWFSGNSRPAARIDDRAHCRQEVGLAQRTRGTAGDAAQGVEHQDRRGGQHAQPPGQVIRSAALISTNETPSRSLATSVSSALVGPQYAHTSVENCTRVARAPSGAPRSAALSASADEGW